jgi:hypothetical protein
VAGDLPEAEVKSLPRGRVANPQRSLRLSPKASNEEKREGDRTSQRRKDNYHLPQRAEPVPQARKGLPQSAATRCSYVLIGTASSSRTSASSGCPVGATTPGFYDAPAFVLTRLRCPREPMPDARRLGARFREFGVVRALIAAIGLVVLFDGFLIAHDSRAATPLLVAGLLLMLFALVVLRPEVREIEARYGEASLILRGARQALGDAAEAGSEEELRMRVAELEAQLEGAAQAVDIYADRLGGWIRAWSGQLDRVERGRAPQVAWSRLLEALSTNASHELHDDHVELRLSTSDPNVGTEVVCSVVDPEGTNSETRIQSHAAPRVFATRYPNEVAHAPALRPGFYTVEWVRPGRAVPGQTKSYVLSRDAFEWPAKQNMAAANGEGA